MDFVGFSLWFAALPESAKESLVGPSAETLGKGINGIASVFANPFIKLGMISEKNIKDYEEKIYSKTTTIPDKNRDSSKQGLAIQALEDSLYRISEEEILEYYSNLIASTLDDRRNNRVHPSFSSILKQMSVEDAILFRKVYLTSKRTLSNYLPLIDVRLKLLPNGGYALPVVDTVLFPDDFDKTHLESNPVSLSSLERLGLIRVSKTAEINGRLQFVSKNTDTYGAASINYGQSYSDIYNSIFNHPDFKEKLSIENPAIGSPEVIKGHIEVTSLADRLGAIIMPNSQEEMSSIFK